MATCQTNLRGGEGKRISNGPGLDQVLSVPHRVHPSGLMPRVSRWLASKEHGWRVPYRGGSLATVALAHAHTQA